MYQLTGCVVAADDVVGVGGAFSRDVCTGVWEAAEGACVGEGLFESVGQFAVIELTVNEFKDSDSVRRGEGDEGIHVAAHVSDAGAIEFGSKNEAAVVASVVEAAEYGRSDSGA